MAFNIKGMTTEQLLNIDINTFNSLTRSELSQVVSRIGATANKRIKTFEKSNIESPAYKSISRGGRISAKGKSLNQLRSEYSRSKTFLQAKTGSVSAYKATRKNTRQSLKESGVNVSDENMDTMFKVYEELKNIDSSITDRKLKYKTMDEVSKMLDMGGSPEDIINFMQGRIQTLYEEMEADEDDISEFFEI